jgi:hypothetical protein
MPDGYLVTQDDVLEVLKMQRDLNFRPAPSSLQHTAYDMLATIAAVSGKSIREFAAERIFGPRHDAEPVRGRLDPGSPGARPAIPS